MKKYQLWLQRKSYSQHLFNLMKIKHATPSPDRPDRTPTPLRPLPDPTHSRYRALEEFHSQAEKLGDISYAITFKELKNRKLRLMKSFEILNENMSMARRIKEVRSVFTSSHEKQGGSAYGKRKLFEKKCQLSNEELRHQSTPVLMRDFRKFQQWQRQRVSPHHKFQLALQPRLAKLAASHQEYAAVWCEVSTDKGFAKSELVDLKHFKGHVFNFALDHALPPDCLFRLFVSKGLDCEMAGQFQFRPPPVGQSAEEEYRSEDGRLEMQMRVRYDRTRSQKPLFTLK